MHETVGLESLAIGWSRQTNHALAANGTTATQSSVTAGGDPSRAIDGNANGVYTGGSVTHTADGMDSWWKMDFGQVRRINRVSLVNRTECSTRLSNFRVSVLDETGVELAGQDFFTSGGNVGAWLVWDLPSLVEARFVKVALLGKNNDGNGYLSLAEVRAWEIASPPANWCLAANGATAAQSTTYGVVSASRAIDGSTNGEWSANSVTHTADAANSWLAVDLGQDRTLDRVILHNRNAIQTRLSNFRVSVLDAAGAEIAGRDFFTTSGNAGNSLVWELPAAVTGRKIEIRLLGKNRDNNGYLSLAEVQAVLSDPRYDTLALQTIPARYLSRHTAPGSDLDDDFLPGAWETAHGLDAASGLGAHGEYGDFDNDGIGNLDEYRYGSDPAVKEALADGLTREIWDGVPGSRITDLVTNARFFWEPTSRAHVPRVDQAGRGDNFGVRYRGWLTAPASGTYTFWVSGDGEVEFWMADGSVKPPGETAPLVNRYGKQRLSWIEAPDSGGNHTARHDFDRYISQRSRPVTLEAGKAYYIEVLHKEADGVDHAALAWKPPGGTREIVPSSALTSDVPEDDDREDDNLPAAWEIQYGLNPNDNGATDRRDGQFGDWDQDGLMNFFEYQLGTHPKLADTDADGFSDKSEVRQYGSDPLVNQQIAPALRATIGLSSFGATSVSWDIRADGTALAHGRRGWTDYTFAIAPGEEGIHEIRLAGGAAGGSVRAEENLPLSLHLNGALLGRHTFRCLIGQSSSLAQMTPWLKAGVYTLRLQNHNVRADCFLRLDSLAVYHLGGNDADGNSIPDWVDRKIHNENRLTRVPLASATSPASIEGVSTSLATLAITSSGSDEPTPALAAIDSGFYADVPLDPAVSTELTVSFQNGASTESRSITWTATNLLDQSALTLRKGDALKLTAHAAGETPSGTFTLSHNGTAIATDRSAAEPFVLRFDQAGTHTLAATWTPADGSAPVSHTLAVTAKTADFGPAFWLQAFNRRTWKVSGVAGMNVEVGGKLGWVETTAAGAAARSFLANAYETGAHHVIARLPATGDIIARGTVEVFDIAAVDETQDAQLVLIRPDGSRVHRFTIVGENLPPHIELRLRTHFQGIVFSNGSRDLTLHAGDFDSNGVANVRIETPDATPHRLCHTVDTFLLPAGP
ncbi:MAG: discoidin domain-containing protein [Verrucomicrobiota bacterium]